LEALAAGNLLFMRRHAAVLVVPITGRVRSTAGAVV
jgi:hypothetical protein